MSVFVALFTDYTLRNVALGSALLGVVSGVLGCFAVLRRQGLIGDALAHAALPGICIAYLLTGTKAPLVLMLGAAVSGWVGMWALLQLVQHTRIKEDAALGIVLSAFFGFGVLLLTFISRRNDANQAGLDKYLFGQAATLTAEDTGAMAALGAIALALVVVFFKELKLLAFDAEFAASLGFNTQALNLLLTTLTVVAVVIGLRTVGVVLMAAMLIGPAVAARQWTNRLNAMCALAALFGALAGVSGALISASESRLPTGPMVILSMTAIAMFSVLFAPARGLVWEQLRLMRHRAQLRRGLSAGE
jgi:manganese/zinc/iron transport system permease protein